MLIYLVGQDRKGEEDEEGAMGPSSGPAHTQQDAQSEVGSPVAELNPLRGLKIDPYWVDNVQEQPECTFSR